MLINHKNKRDRASHIIKHLQNSKQCRNSCSNEYFSILDHAFTTFQLKIKEAIIQTYTTASTLSC